MTSPPWTRVSLQLVAALSIAGLAMVALASVEAAKETTVAAQVKWLNLGVLGIVLSGSAQAGWLVMAHRAVSLLRSQALELVISQHGDSTTSLDDDPTAPSRGAAPAGGPRVHLAGSSWHHDPSCLLVAGKPVETAADLARLEPCPACGLP